MIMAGCGHQDETIDTMLEVYSTYNTIVFAASVRVETVATCGSVDALSNSHSGNAVPTYQ